MIDQDGFRLNVGIILAHPTGSVLWARRRGEDAWQFPQGGMQSGETPEDTLYRELHEELGIAKHQVFVLAQTAGTAFTKDLQRRMEGVVLNLPNGSYAQRVQAEYLKEVEDRGKEFFAGQA